MPRLALLLFLAAGLAACASDLVETAVRQGDRAMNRLRYTEAVEHFDRAIAADAERADAFLGRGRAYWAMGQFENAVADLDRAIDLDPGGAWAYYFRGSSRLQLGRFEPGIEDLVEAARTEGLPVEDRRRAHYLRAVAHMHLEQYGAGIEALTESIALRPDFAFYYFERGQLYEMTGQTDAAVADFEQYLSLAEPDTELAEQAQQRLAALRPATATS
ncbi:MAG: tetratricopeptide repeat protein [Bacteroidota bacterium]